MDYTHQAPLSMAFPRQEYWSRQSCPPPRDLPSQGIRPTWGFLLCRWILHHWVIWEAHEHRYIVSKHLPAWYIYIYHSRFPLSVLPIFVCFSCFIFFIKQIKFCILFLTLIPKPKTNSMKNCSQSQSHFTEFSDTENHKSSILTHWRNVGSSI